MWKSLNTVWAIYGEADGMMVLFEVDDWKPSYWYTWSDGIAG